MKPMQKKPILPALSGVVAKPKGQVLRRIGKWFAVTAATGLVAMGAKEMVQKVGERHALSEKKAKTEQSQLAVREAERVAKKLNMKTSDLAPALYRTQKVMDLFKMSPTNLVDVKTLRFIDKLSQDVSKEFKRTITPERVLFTIYANQRGSFEEANELMKSGVISVDTILEKTRSSNSIIRQNNNPGARFVLTELVEARDPQIRGRVASLLKNDAAFRQVRSTMDAQDRQIKSGKFSY